jgi:hypothetical protein
VPEILHIDLSNEGTGIKENKGITHGLLGAVVVIVPLGTISRALNTQLS